MRMNDTTKLIGVVLGFIFVVLGTLGNSAVIIYNIFLNRDKTPSSWLVTHLAFADLLVCLTVHLMIILKFFFKDKLNDILCCRTVHSTLYVSLFLSIMFLLVITIDKYLYIAKPLKYPMIVTKRRIFKIIRSIWVAALVQFPIIYICIKELKAENTSEKCHYPDSLVYLLILQLVPIGVIAILNYKMLKIVKEQRQKIALEVVLQQLPHEESEQERSEQNQTWLRRLAIELKAVKTFAIIIGVLMFCFVPHIVISLIRSKVPSDHGTTRTAKVIGKQLVGLNSIANAGIYALRHKKYTRAYKQLFLSAWARLSPKNN